MTDNGLNTGPHGRAEPSLPQVFGRYLLVQRLSRGGMGEIFLAKHGLAGFEKLAVIKKVLPHLAADAQFISRFVDEAQVAIKLQHVNVAQVFEVGRVGEEYFLALEYVEGRDLRRTLARLIQAKQRMPVDLALFIARELANGLAYAHRRTSSDGASLNLVHCDISPPNVLVSFEGETKVIDFGIAKSAIRGTATDPKMGFGKFGYMAPEQLIRGGVVDHRTDLYAAGVVLFELLTGQRLYEAGAEPDYRALARKVAKGEHALPSEVEPSLAPYDDLVATALRPTSDDRYQTAAEFRDAIQQCLVSVNPTISTDQLGSFMRDLFTDEMNAQKELHERVAKAHLADFQEQLTTQTVSTVSFALMNMPLPAPPEDRAPALPVRPSTQQQVPRASTQQPVQRAPTQQPPSTQMLVSQTEELSLADGTGTVPPLQMRGRGRVVAFGVAAAVLVVGSLVFAMTRSGSESVPKDNRSAVVAAANGPGGAVNPPVDPPPQQPTVEHITPIDAAVEVAVTPADAAVAPPPIDPAIQVDKPNPHKTQTGRKPHPDPKRHDPLTKHDSKADPLTHEQVAAKFQAVKREYDGYKAKNGAVLEGEWNNLADFIQYHPTDVDDQARRIDAFRAKLRE